MVDFHQEGLITTLHSLHQVLDQEAYLTVLEQKLEEYSHHLRIGLLLPCLYSELQNTEVLDRILAEIQNVRYLHKVVVALGATHKEDHFREAKVYFAKLRTPERSVDLVWVDGPRIQQILQEIQNRQITVGVQGKGQSVWLALGYFFSKEDCDVIALHDCDIVTYSSLLLGRLLEPTANPNNEFEFCKGFYVRISPTELVLKGRVTRLFVTPFVDTLKNIMNMYGYADQARFFSYHRTFNYPLAGEFSFTSKLARGINIAYDWGLEVSTLSEVYHRVIPRKITQIDLVQNYEHKHQSLSFEDKSKGLHRMVVDIAKFFLNYLRSHNFPLDDATVDMILHSYYENALGFIKAYSDDAEVNGLNYDRYQEELTTQYFRGFIWEAWEQAKGPRESTLIPSWNRVCFSLPDIYPRLLEAVEADNGS